MIDEPHKRLMAARERAGFATASDAARSFGWNENTYRSHENGERGIRPTTAAKYAAAFKASTAYILVGEQQDIPTNNSRLILSGNIDDEAIINLEKYAANYQTGKAIFAALFFRESAYAFEVMHDDLFGFLSRGDLVIASRHGSDVNDCLGRLCFVKFEETKGCLTYVRKGSIEGMIDTSISPRRPERLINPISIHLVMSVLFKGQWSKVPMSLYKLPREDDD